jgi:bifunctional non-homologous end joining protein LigD
VKWEEVEQALKKRDATLLVFKAGQVLDRVGKMGDLFEPVLKLKQKLPKLAGIAETAPSAIEERVELAAQAEDTKKAKKSKKSPRKSPAPKKRGRKV